nr:hypothetical protein [Parvularcula marina]
MPRGGMFGKDGRRGGSQAAFDAIAHHGIAELFRDGEADSDFISAVWESLQQKSAP